MSRRRSVGEGSVYDDATRDRWLGALTLPNGQRKRVVGEESHRGTSEARSTSALSRARRGRRWTATPRSADAVDLWSTRVLAARRLAPRTRERYARHCEVIKDALGSRRLAKLTADDIEAMLDREGAEGALSRDTLTKLRSTLVQVLDFAVRRGLAVSNPAVHATVPADAARAAARKSLTPDEARVLFAACEDEHARSDVPPRVACRHASRRAGGPSVE